MPSTILPLLMATCPLCERFSGSPESVEAHISGSGDEDHEGEIGKDFREQLRGVATSAASKAAQTAKRSGSSTGDTSDNSNSNGVQADDSATQSGSSSRKGKPPKTKTGTEPEPPEFLQSNGGIETAKIEEDEESGAALTLVATGALAWFLWLWLGQNQGGQQPDRWEGI